MLKLNNFNKLTGAGKIGNKPIDLQNAGFE